MNPTTVEIDQVLLDVRRAYRILHDYQRMVLDAVDYIGKMFGMSYIGGYPKFSNAAPRDGKGRLSNWAWDWLNMVFYEFYFRPEGSDESKSIRFSVLVISDTGFFCAKDEKLAPTDVAEFLPATLSATKIGFILSGPTYDEFAFLKNRMQMKKFVENGGELPDEYAAKGVFGKCVDLARLVSEEETNALLDELEAFARKSGLPLTRISRNV